MSHIWRPIYNFLSIPLIQCTPDHFKMPPNRRNQTKARSKLDSTRYQKSENAVPGLRKQQSVRRKMVANVFKRVSRLRIHGPGGKWAVSREKVSLCTRRTERDAGGPKKKQGKRKGRARTRRRRERNPVGQGRRAGGVEPRGTSLKPHSTDRTPRAGRSSPLERSI